MRLLIIAKDQIFTEKLSKALKQVPYNVDTIDSIKQGLYWARTTDYDLIMVEHSELNNAIEVCSDLRNKGIESCLLILTEVLSSDDAIALFNCGIDDYVSKHSLIAEITARIKALLRRPKQQLKDCLKIGDLTLDCRDYSVTRNKKSVYLTRKEFNLLEYLLRHQDRVLSRTDLIEHVWDINADLFSNSLETHILNLRKKIEQPGRPKLIHTISGRGYRIAMQN